MLRNRSLFPHAANFIEGQIMTFIPAPREVHCFMLLVDYLCTFIEGLCGECICTLYYKNGGLSAVNYDWNVIYGLIRGGLITGFRVYTSPRKFTKCQRRKLRRGNFRLCRKNQRITWTLNIWLNFFIEIEIEDLSTPAAAGKLRNNPRSLEMFVDMQKFLTRPGCTYFYQGFLSCYVHT